MHIMCAAFAGIGAFAICGTATAPAAEQSPARYLKSDAPFDAKWDRCEALARKRGTPPGKAGYGDFIDACLEKTPSRPTSDGGAAMKPQPVDGSCDAARPCLPTTGAATKP
jgi:hypothetical protein